MKKTILLFTLIIFSVSFLTKNSIAQKNIILKQKDAPVSLFGFEAKYQSGGSTYTKEGIRYEVEFGNQSGKQIVAYQISFLAFDVFNRNLGRPFGGYAIETIDHMKNKKGVWLYRKSNTALFKDYGTALVYVSYLRFADGEIWKYSESEILPQIQEIEESFTLENLQPE